MDGESGEENFGGAETAGFLERRVGEREVLVTPDYLRECCAGALSCVAEPLGVNSDCV